MQLAADIGRLPSNPESRHKPRKQIKNRKKFLTHEQVAALTGAVIAKPAREDFGLLVLVFAHAGPRVRDLDFVRDCLEVHRRMIEVNGSIRESTPKDYEEPSIPVPPSILEPLAMRVEGKSQADHVFVVSKSGAVLTNRAFRHGWFEDAAAGIGTPSLTPDELLHTCAGLAVSVGANVKALQRMLGHSSAKDLQHLQRSVLRGSGRCHGRPDATAAP